MSDQIAVSAPVDTEAYDEFSLLTENATELGLAIDALPAVERHVIDVGGGQSLSMLRWGAAEPEVVFLHGGGQNAHTWDSVILTLGRPALAIDLPGHGRSDRRTDKNYGPWLNAEAVAVALEQVASHAAGVVGMSLGGATTIRLAAVRPDVARRAVIVDVTPQVNDPSRPWTPQQRGSVALISGPPAYETFDAMVEAAVGTSPQRAPAAVRRGVRHNSYRQDDGRWAWRYDLFGDSERRREWNDFTPLWDDVASISVPTLLVQGGDSVFVQPEDVERFGSCLPSARVEVVPRAGHAVQSDQPRRLAALIDEFVFGRGGVRSG